MVPFDEAWMGRLVDASATMTARPGQDARVAVAVDGGEPVVLDIRDGRIAGTADGEAQVEVPLTAAQAEAAASGELSLAVAYMKGDVKPVGSSGALAVFLEVVEEPATWRAWRS